MPGPLIQLETQGIETQLLFNPTLLATLRAPRFASLRFFTVDTVVPKPSRRGIAKLSAHGSVTSSLSQAI